jgi:hypothetical protein
MSSGDRYRAQASKLDAQARHEANTTLKTELFALAAGYRRLATQADRNASTDLTYETPQPNVQQQQQIQPKRKNEKDQ